MILSKAISIFCILATLLVIHILQFYEIEKQLKKIFSIFCSGIIVLSLSMMSATSSETIEEFQLWTLFVTTASWMIGVLLIALIIQICDESIFKKPILYFLYGMCFFFCAADLLFFLDNTHIEKENHIFHMTFDRTPYMILRYAAQASIAAFVTWQAMYHYKKSNDIYRRNLLNYFVISLFLPLVAIMVIRILFGNIYLEYNISMVVVTLFISGFAYGLRKHHFLLQKEDILNQHVSKVMDNFLLLLSSEKKIINYNHKVKQLLNQDSILTQSIQQIIHNDELHSFLEQNTSMKIKDIELNLKIGNNSVPTIASCTRIIDNETPIGYILIARDVSPLKEKERQIEQSNRELEQFASVASHDMKQPLRMMSSYSGLLRNRYSDVLDEKGNLFVHHIEDGAQRLSRMIDALLEFSRIGKQDISFKELSLHKLLDISTMNLHYTIQEKKAKIIYPNQDITLLGDKNTLIRLFQNIIGNGIKYTIEKAPIIEIKYKEKNNRATIYIKDNGQGIPEEELDEVFELFNRASNSNTASGTGIGLAICKKIINLHQGKIGLESELGEGSTFYFDLPVRVSSNIPATI